MNKGKDIVGKEDKETQEEIEENIEEEVGEKTEEEVEEQKEQEEVTQVLSDEDVGTENDVQFLDKHESTWRMHSDSENECSDKEAGDANNNRKRKKGELLMINNAIALLLMHECKFKCVFQLYFHSIFSLPFSYPCYK